MTEAPLRRFVPGPATEDWCAVVIGLFLVAVSAFVFHASLGLQHVAAAFQAWANLAELLDQFAGDIPHYVELGGTLLNGLSR
jgi:hypothetical protein